MTAVTIHRYRTPAILSQSKGVWRLRRTFRLWFDGLTTNGKGTNSSILHKPVLNKAEGSKGMRMRNRGEA